MSSSIDSDRGSIINAFNVFDREGELCRNYTCCGIHLNDLHALLEHFEDVHILVVDPKAPAQIHVPFNPQCLDPPPPSFDSSDDMEFDIDLDSSSLHSVPPTPAATSSRSSPSSAAPTPPRTPISSAYPSPTVAAPPALAYLQPQSQYIQAPQFTQYQSTPSHTSQPPSPGMNSQPHPHLGAFLQNHPNVVAHPEDAFNSYARFSSDYSSHLPGAQYNAASGDDQVVVPPEYTGAPTVVGDYPANQQQGYLGQPIGMQIPDAQGQQCIPPALLFGTINATAGEKKTRDAVNRSSPQPLPSKVRLKIRALGDHATRSTPTTPTTISPSHTPGPSSTTPSTTTNAAPNPATNQVQVATSSLLLSKPFRCPKPNCNKSYKQANGLKYHMTHGSCNFAPPKDLEHVKDLLERKRREREAREEENNGAGGSGRNGLSRSASVGSIGTKGATSPRTTDGSGALNSNPTDSYYTDLAGLGSITETELREVEREAEKRLRPFACGVGDCQRRYKNMNGLRYHYQHSGDHGAVGLALLAGGLHECLSGNAHHRNDSHNNTSSNPTATDTDPKNKPKHHQYAHNPTLALAHNLGLNYSSHIPGHGVGEEREGRKRALYRTAAAAGRGSASVPVSRAGSVAGGSRVATPGLAKAGQNQNPNGAQLGGANGSPPLTPLTAAVQGLGLGVNATGTGTRSQPHSPTGNGFMQQQQHQVQYQKQFMELQRRQYFQQQQAAIQQQQQQQEVYQHQQQQETYVQQQQQQQEFHPEFQPTQQNEFHPPQLQEYHLVQSSPTQAQGQVPAQSQPQSPTQPPDFQSPRGEYLVAGGDFPHPQQGTAFPHPHPHPHPHHQQQQHQPNMNMGMNESFDAQAQQEFVEEQRVQAERAQKQRELERGFQQRFGGVGDVAMV